MSLTGHFKVEVKIYKCLELLLSINLAKRNLSLKKISVHISGQRFFYLFLLKILAISTTTSGMRLKRITTVNS